MSSKIQMNKKSFIVLISQESMKLQARVREVFK